MCKLLNLLGIVSVLCFGNMSLCMFVVRNKYRKKHGEMKKKEADVVNSLEKKGLWYA